MFVPNGLARAAVRFKPASFAGTFVALLLAAAIVSACGILLETGLRASVPPDRYAKAPVIVAADQQARLTVGSGDDRHEESSALPDTARLSDTLVARAAAAPGATAAIGDVGYPVRLGAAHEGPGSAADGVGSTTDGSEADRAGSTPDGVGSAVHGSGSTPDGVGSAADGTGSTPDGAGSVTDGTGSTPDGSGSTPHGVRSATHGVGSPVRQGSAPLTAHGWGSAALTGTRLASGDAPRTGEVVVPAGHAGARTGDRVTLDTPAGPKEFRVSGTTDADATVWFTDREAVALSGHPGRVDAIAVLAADPAALARQVSDALGHPKGVKVSTGDDRGAVEDPGLADARELLIGLGGSFGGVATMVAVFTAAGTVALSVGQRSREFALLRAIGATPRQLRRSIATESLLVAPLAGALGWLPGIALAAWWFGQLKAKGAVPDAVGLRISWLPLTIAVAAAMFTALSAGYAAARRPSKTKPGLALAQSAVERPPFGWIRTPLGIAALAGGGVFAGIAASQTGDDAANAALGVVMLFMLAVGLLGPLIARICASVLGLPLRAGGASASLAAANSHANSRRMASAITPIVLAMAFSSTLVFMHTSEDRATEHQQRDAFTADHIVSAPAGLASDATERAAATPGVSTAVGLLRTSVLVPGGSGGDTWLENAPAQGVIGSGRELAAVQDLDVRTGSLDALAPGTVAIDTTLASSAKAHTGDRLALRLPDGTKASPKIVAVYGRGLGAALVTLPSADLRTHVTSPYASDVFVRATPAGAERLAALGTVTDPSGYATARSRDRELNAWANTVMAAVLGGFAAVAAVNTLVMTVLDRRRELTMLRLVGSTRRQIMGMIRWEALLVTVAGAALGTAIALATLIPMMRGLTGESPYIPPALYGSFLAATVGLGLAAALVPARAALSRAAARP
ncbi:FtsX-like permease family protein [Streptomyces sp. ITFR-6]|uniref:ABC transporter permease n=1 Tax=Streptomyces sp. ITFR-6 TaxID=3075197 RepID=UPI00288AF0F1|nr:FtsX-like permease family protein [Streptomyces sp. ITFR-6]WNI31926.1 FtsX-like permease family protein [Streptomyces sp. ITFR-6]